MLPDIPYGNACHWSRNASKEPSVFLSLIRMSNTICEVIVFVRLHSCLHGIKRKLNSCQYKLGVVKDNESLTARNVDRIELKEAAISVLYCFSHLFGDFASRPG